MKYFLALIILTLSTYAQTLETKALDFLFHNRSEGGLWSLESKRALVDNRKVVQVLNNLTNDNAKLMVTQAFLNLGILVNQNPENIQSAIIDLILDENSNKLIAMQNPDGGWGASKGKKSNSLDTVLAINALLEANINGLNWSKSIGLISNLRSESGFWQLSEDSTFSKVELTARILQALNKLSKQESGNVVLDTLIAETSELLLGLHQIDGHFKLSDESGEIKTTAEVYKALVKNVQPSLLVSTSHLLISSQNEDGSWYDKNEEQFYTTAVVLEAVGSLNISNINTVADLAVLSQGISFNPSSPNLGDRVTVSALIFNLGNNLANNVDIRAYTGDPRSTSISINKKIIDSILPGKSQLVQFELDTSDLSYNPKVFIIIDEDYEIQEVNRTNNIAFRKLTVGGLDDEEIVNGADLYINDKDISLDGGNGNNVLLEGKTINIGLNISNIGTEDSIQSTLILKDGDQELAELIIPSIKALESHQVFIPWKPSSGLHELSVVIDNKNLVSEINENNNSASTSLEVLAGSVAVIAKKVENNQEVEPPVGAYTGMHFTVITSHANSYVNLVIRHTESSFQASPVELKQAGKFYWNTANSPSGTYSVTAYFRSSDDDSLLDTAIDEFTIFETKSLRKLTPIPSKTIVEGGELQPIDLSVSIANGSNLDETWNLSWVLENSAKEEVLSSNTDELVTLLGSKPSHVFKFIGKISGEINIGGRYTLTVTASNDEGKTISGSTVLTILSSFELTVVNKLMPNEVSPLGRARVKTEIKLSAAGQGGDLSLPVSVSGFSQLPSGEIADVAEVQITISANKILNLLGQQVPDGTKVAVYIPYGSISSGTDPLPNKFNQINPQYRFEEVQNGKLDISYSPRGGVLTSGQTSVIVMEIYQILPEHLEDGEWQGKLIGTYQINLKGN